MLNPAYIGVIILGLVHGVEPGHGWPVAVLRSVKQKNTILSAILSASIIGAGHLISSIAVVVAYVLLQQWLDFDAPWIKYLAAGVLFLLAIKLARETPEGLKSQHGHIHENEPEVEYEHEHEHDGKGTHIHLHKHTTGIVLSLWGLASFAFILGFAHEEEFALLALVAGGVNAWVLMISYSLAVIVGLIFVTVTCVKLYKSFQPKLVRYEKYVPKISAAILAAMALVIIIW